MNRLDTQVHLVDGLNCTEVIVGLSHDSLLLLHPPLDIILDQLVLLSQSLTRVKVVRLKPLLQVPFSVHLVDHAGYVHDGHVFRTLLKPQSLDFLHSLLCLVDLKLFPKLFILLLDCLNVQVLRHLLGELDILLEVVRLVFEVCHHLQHLASLGLLEGKDLQPVILTQDLSFLFFRESLRSTCSSYEVITTGRVILKRSQSLVRHIWLLIFLMPVPREPCSLAATQIPGRLVHLMIMMMSLLPRIELLAAAIEAFKGTLFFHEPLPELDRLRSVIYLVRGGDAHVIILCDD